MIPDIVLSCSLPGTCMFSVYDDRPQPCEDCEGCEHLVAHIEERVL